MLLIATCVCATGTKVSAKATVLSHQRLLHLYTVVIWLQVSAGVLSSNWLEA